MATKTTKFVPHKNANDRSKISTRAKQKWLQNWEKSTLQGK